MVDGVDVSHDQLFKALHGFRCECYGSVVIYAGYLGGLLKTFWYYRLGQGEVENVSEDTWHLVSACSQDTSW